MKNMINTALITGGAKRIGAGVAKTLADNGFKLAIHYNKSRMSLHPEIYCMLKLKAKPKLKLRF